LKHEIRGKSGYVAPYGPVQVLGADSVKSSKIGITHDERFPKEINPVLDGGSRKKKIGFCFEQMAHPT